MSITGFSRSGFRGHLIATLYEEGKGWLYSIDDGAEIGWSPDRATALHHAETRVNDHVDYGDPLYYSAVYFLLCGYGAETRAIPAVRSDSGVGLYALRQHWRPDLEAVSKCLPKRLRTALARNGSSTVWYDASRSNMAGADLGAFTANAAEIHLSNARGKRIATLYLGAAIKDSRGSGYPLEKLEDGSSRLAVIDGRTYRRFKAICDKAAEYWEANASHGKQGSSMSAELAAHPDYARCTNEMRGKVEQYETLANPPAKLFAYWKQLDSWRYMLTTWTGDVIGYGRISEPYRSNMGDSRAHWTGRIAGRLYHGTLQLSAGTYGRFTQAKGE